ncbi:MAG: DNA double-strand break repair nuclease NurA, partial [Chloroflexi bacterium]|nr:DNA double-strand break repair nuclease NurA [Chloroflexota bacterium]
HRTLAVRALEAAKDKFATFDRAFGDELQLYRHALDGLARLSGAEIEERLAGVPSPGALPTGEFGRFPGLVIPFAQRWRNHQEARAWALQTLGGVTTFAVDGSQIQPSKDFSIPVAAIQVAWFENHHSPERAHVKDATVEVIPPEDLYVDSGDGYAFSESTVGQRRFCLEVDRLVEYVCEDRGEGPKPLVFLDGSLIVSFAGKLPPESRGAYVRGVVRLLRASEECGVPLVGYVDTTYAKDLTRMLQRVDGLMASQRVHDAQLLSSRMQWGDRSVAWICAREGILDEYLDAETGRPFGRGICFAYLKTTSGNPTARIEFPRWLLDKGNLDQVMDVIRAECIVGNGYPYTIEAADATAVLTAQDRERFYGLFQEFVERNGLNLRFSSKAASKQRRR